MSTYLAVDCESTSLDPRSAELTHVAVWVDSGYGDVFSYPADEEDIACRLGTQDEAKLFYNAKYDLTLLRRHGFEIQGPILDVLVLSRVVLSKERSFKLKELSKKYLKEPYEEDDELKAYMKAHKLKTFEGIPDEIIEPYALKDAQCTFELFWLLRKKLKGQLLELFKREMKVLHVVMAMEDRGVLIDTKYAKDLYDRAERNRELIKRQLPFNPASPKQVREYMEEWKKDGKYLPSRYTATGVRSTDEIALREWGTPEGRLILDYRSLTKAKSTYLGNFLDRADEFCVLRANFNQAGAITGRFSSSQPNLQNIPRPSDRLLGLARNAIKAREDHLFIFLDYDQVELRLAAHFANESSMIKAIQAGEDLHALTCEKVFKIYRGHPDWKDKRYIAKTLNFAILYGAGAVRLRDALLKRNVNLPRYECTEIIQNYKKEYPGIQQLFMDIDYEVEKHGGVRNPYGRFMKVASQRSYAGVNFLIQSTAADLLKERLVTIHGSLKSTQSAIVATVHDEIIVELHQDDRECVGMLKNAMEEREKFRVPLTCTVSYGKTWGKKKKL